MAKVVMQLIEEYIGPTRKTTIKTISNSFSKSDHKEGFFIKKRKMKIYLKL